MNPREFFIDPAAYGLPTRDELVAYRIWDNHFHGFASQSPIEQYERNNFLVERNGHHYYCGLSLWPADWQDAMLAAHGDLYARHRDGFARLQIRQGRVALGSVNTAPLGVVPCSIRCGLSDSQCTDRRHGVSLC